MKCLLDWIKLQCKILGSDRQLDWLEIESDKQSTI